MHVTILGAGLVGRRTAELLSNTGDFTVALLSRSRPVDSLPDIPGVFSGRGWPHKHVAKTDIVVLATESAQQPAAAREFIRSGIHVVSTADDPGTIDRLWSLEAEAAARGVVLVVGAAYSPGVSTLLAAYPTTRLTDVTTITTAQFGTGGPACARQHHRAMGASSLEVHDGRLRVSRGGSGRELVWFPDPIGAADCYRAGLADPVLLHRAFPEVARIESRQAATRRDRLTARLPMLRPPHPEGLIGAVSAEVRGRIDGRVEHQSMAATAPQAWGAAAMAAAVCRELAGEQGVQNDKGCRTKGNVLSAATAGNLVSLLQHVSDGVRLWTYDGTQIVVNSEETGQIHAARKWNFPEKTA